MRKILKDKKEKMQEKDESSSNERSILEGLPDPLFVADNELVITYFTMLRLTLPGMHLKKLSV